MPDRIPLNHEVPRLVLIVLATAAVFVGAMLTVRMFVAATDPGPEVRAHGIIIACVAAVLSASVVFYAKARGVLSARPFWWLVSRTAAIGAAVVGVLCVATAEKFAALVVVLVTIYAAPTIVPAVWLFRLVLNRDEPAG
jgi:hypothetical protein